MLIPKNQTIENAVRNFLFEPTLSEAFVRAGPGLKSDLKFGREPAHQLFPTESDFSDFQMEMIHFSTRTLRALPYSLVQAYRECEFCGYLLFWYVVVYKQYLNLVHEE